jgi:hypothetical protein
MNEYRGRRLSGDGMRTRPEQSSPISPQRSLKFSGPNLLVLGGLDVSDGKLVASKTRNFAVGGEFCDLHAAQGRLQIAWRSVVDIFVNVIIGFHLHESFHRDDCTHLERGVDAARVFGPGGVDVHG